MYTPTEQTDGLLSALRRRPSHCVTAIDSLDRPDSAMGGEEHE